MKLGIIELHDDYGFDIPNSYKQLIRCKECKWDKAQMIPKSVKCIYQHNPDDFCSYGERSEQC